MSIEEILKYRFNNGLLLEEALTHPGCAEVRNGAAFNYQRLEFLGDAVLGVVIAELLLKLYPQEDEGSLAKRQAALIKGDALATVARTLGLGAHMRMNGGNTQDAGRHLNSSLEDVCEAVIGALYLDGGYETARSFVLEHWEKQALAMSAPPKDAKTALQEWAQGRGLSLPDYKIIATTGPAHAPEFTISVAVTGAEPALAKASSKRQAEQLAAKMLLEKING